jgi:hypothetical protein
LVAGGSQWSPFKHQLNMGLTIHYSGKLRNPDALSALIREAADISESMKWPYETISKTKDIPVEGILISPEGSEPLWLTFHEDGFMCNPILYGCVFEVEGKEITAEAEQWLFTKTQYAGAETHIALINLLHYLKEQYFERLEVHDESGFWESNDEVKCRETFARHAFMLNEVGNALDELVFDPEASQESVMEMIGKMLEERFGMKRSTD